MPIPSPATRLRLSRRAALGAVLAAGGGWLAACTPEPRGVTRRETPPEPVEPRVDPDVAVATAALEAQTEVLELVRATQERHARLVERLRPALAAHEAHVALLADAVPEEDGPTVAPSEPASGSPSPSGGADRRTGVPRNPARALRRVVVAEQRLATVTKQHAFKAQSGAFARVLASMAASAAQHAAVLGGPPAGGGS